jgi:glutamine synthetase
MLAAGMDGIRRELPVPEATEENLYLIEAPRRGSRSILPGSLDKALNALEEDEVIQGALGPHISTRFLEAKRLEWEEYATQVTSWELAKYLPLY